MTKKLIALFGVANVGKSNTIRKVYDMLISRYTIVKTEYEILAKDIRIILTIDGIKIGIESQGDPDSRLEESLKIFVKVGCDVIICATRTRGHTVDLVKNCESTYEVIWFQQDKKSDHSEYEASNRAMAQKIINEIKKVINA